MSETNDDVILYESSQVHCIGVALKHSHSLKGLHTHIL